MRQAVSGSQVRALSRNRLASKPNLLNKTPQTSKCNLLAATLPKEYFHTSKLRPAIPPLLLVLIKPLSRLTAMIVGRRIRKWRRNLGDEQREKIKQKTNEYSRLIGGVGFFLLSFGIYGYESHIEEVPITKRRRFVALTKGQMEQISAREFEEHLKENQADILPTNNTSYTRIARVAHRIIAANKDLGEISKKEWTITVIDDPQKNAFVLPTGNIFVYTGMLDMCANDDQLGIILGHEMSHAILNHSAEAISHGNLFSVLLIVPLAMLWAAVPNDGLALVADWIFNKVAKLMIELPYSRAIEKEADEVGLLLAAKACFDVREAKVFWRKMAYLTHSDPTEVELPEFLSTHPAHTTRLEDIARLLPSTIIKRLQCGCSRLKGPDPDIACVQAIASMTLEVMPHTRLDFSRRRDN